MERVWQTMFGTVGFALYLTINAITIWGGFFPLLPASFQTPLNIIVFFIAQALGFTGTILAFGALALRSPRRGAGIAAVFPAVVCLGSVCIISSMYLEAYALALVVLGGTFLGAGCAGLFTMWQIVFAAMPADLSNLSIVLGAIATPLIYAAVSLAPEAIAAFLVPIFLAPLCGTCLSVALRGISTEQPMFEDAALDYGAVYQQALHDHWRGALCLAALGFASGVVRGVAVLHPEIVYLVNEASLAGLLVAGVLLLLVCTLRWIKIDLTGVFRIAYPALICGFMCMPFLGPRYFAGFVTLSYLAFSLIQMLMMMQSAQISRNRGIHPAFAFSLFAGPAYLMQSTGFGIGWFGTYAPVNPDASAYFISQAALFVLGISLFIAVGSSLKKTLLTGSASSDAVELFFPSTKLASVNRVATRLQEAGLRLVGGIAGPAHAEKAPAAPTERAVTDDADPVRDRISKQCQALKRRFGLTIREVEITDLLARGHSAPSVAAKLVISEHTVKTHFKHIYAKLGIHKREELLELLEETLPSKES